MSGEDLLQRPCDEACRVVALGYLDEAVAARARLGSDPEGLHDLRVALRRLRSTLRAYRDRLGGLVGGRERKQLRRVVDATGAARDAEVLLGLVTDEAAGLQPGEREGTDWLCGRLAAQKAEGYAAVEGRLDQLAWLERRLRRRLSRVQFDLAHPDRQAHALAARIESHTDDLEDDLAELRTPDQIEDAHAARISAKRLRYLIEPFKRDDAVALLVTPLKKLQDLLGDLHDTHVAIAEARRALADAATPPQARDGLAALVVRLDVRVVRLFGDLGRRWLAGPELVGQARALAAELRSR